MISYFIFFTFSFKENMFLALYFTNFIHFIYFFPSFTTEDVEKLNTLKKTVREQQLKNICRNFFGT